MPSSTKSQFSAIETTVVDDVKPTDDDENLMRDADVEYRDWDTYRWTWEWTCDDEFLDDVRLCSVDDEMLDDLNEEELDKEIEELQRLVKGLEIECQLYEKCVDAILRAGGQDAGRELLVALEKMEATFDTYTYSDAVAWTETIFAPILKRGDILNFPSRANSGQCQFYIHCIYSTDHDDDGRSSLENTRPKRRDLQRYIRYMREAML